MQSLTNCFRVGISLLKIDFRVYYFTLATCAFFYFLGSRNCNYIDKKNH